VTAPESDKQKRRDAAATASAFKEHLQSDGRLDRLRALLAFMTGLRPLGGLLIFILIAIGELEDRPYDISSLAATLGEPRTSALRHLTDLQALGLVERRLEGRRSIISLTDDGWVRLAEWRDKIRPALDRLVRSQAKHVLADRQPPGTAARTGRPPAEPAAD
jgi:DNA-binding MarR family transcriptional regulator